MKKNTIIYDYECASKPNTGHCPYYNHMIKIFDGKVDERKTLLHYDNTMDVNKDTFEYIMQVVTYQCDKFIEAKDSKKRKIN